MNPVPQVVASLLGYGVEWFVESEYGFPGLLGLAALTLFLSAERRSRSWALAGAALAVLALTQA